jgi:hypothetical protein
MMNVNGSVKSWFRVELKESLLLGESVGDVRVEEGGKVLVIDRVEVVLETNRIMFNTPNLFTLQTNSVRRLVRNGEEIWREKN